MLVELLLQPVDVGVASAAQSGLGCVRCASCGDQDSRAPALRVVQHPAEVLCADIDVHEHCLRPSRRLVVAMRRGKRDELEQAEHGARHWLAKLLELRQRFLDRDRVGARIHEQALDALFHQRANVRFR